MQNRGYNVELKTHPGLGHSWKNEDVINFLKKCLLKATQAEKQSSNTKTLTTVSAILLAIALIILGILFYQTHRKKTPIFFK